MRAALSSLLSALLSYSLLSALLSYSLLDVFDLFEDLGLIDMVCVGWLVGVG
jgi:hypothetical protein